MSNGSIIMIVMIIIVVTMIGAFLVWVFYQYDTIHKFKQYKLDLTNGKDIRKKIKEFEYFCPYKREVVSEAADKFCGVLYYQYLNGKIKDKVKIFNEHDLDSITYMRNSNEFTCIMDDTNYFKNIHNHHGEHICSIDLGYCECHFAFGYPGGKWPFGYGELCVTNIFIKFIDTKEYLSLNDLNGSELFSYFNSALLREYNRVKRNYHYSLQNYPKLAKMLDDIDKDYDKDNK